MATNISQWTLSDCIDFVQRSIKSFKDKIPESVVDDLINSLQCNHVTGSTLKKFTDDEWKELVQSIGLRVHIRDSFKKLLKDEEKEALSQLHRKGLPKKPVEETAELIPLRKITSFFSKKDVLALPEDAPLSLPAEPEIPVNSEPVSIVTVENLAEFIKFMLSRSNASLFTPVLMRRVILQYLAFHHNNVRHTATKLATLSVACGDKDTEEIIENRWRSKINYFRKQPQSEEINLEEYITHFKANGSLLNKRKRCPASTVRVSVNPCGRRPVWGPLEIALTDWIKDMHSQRKPVIRILVLKKALELEPNFMGGLLAPDFMKRAMPWYYRYINRRAHHLSIQKPTSVGQKLPDGWQDFWRTCVKDVLALRRHPDILQAYNSHRPDQVPADILPVAHICNFDQSPQSVEPVANTTLAPKGSGECVVKTGANIILHIDDIALTCYEQEEKRKTG